MIIYHCTRDSALFLSYLLLCHPYIPFHFIEMIFILVISKNILFSCIYIYTLGLALGIYCILGTS